MKGARVNGKEVNAGFDVSESYGPRSPYYRLFQL